MIKTLFASALLATLCPNPANARPSADDHARFSTTRFAAEVLGGELVGALATGLTFNGLCDGRDCLGSAIAAFGANLAVTPLAVWGIGQAMGGEGSLGYSYLGASVALTPFSVTGSVDESPNDALARVTVEAWVSSILLAPCSALLYEATSHAKWSREHGPGVTFRLAHDHSGAMGFAAVVSGRW